jgi:hypothetical protein
VSIPPLAPVGAEKEFVLQDKDIQIKAEKVDSLGVDTVHVIQ